MLPLAIATWSAPTASVIDSRPAVPQIAMATSRTASTAGFRHSRSAVPTVLVLAHSTLGGGVAWGEAPSEWSWIGIVASIAAILLIGREPRAAHTRGVTEVVTG